MVAERLRDAGVPSELVTYHTTGDRNLAQPLSEIGAKGLFTKELEDDLARGKVQCCVHSLKDLPTEMPEGLELGALLPREDPATCSSESPDRRELDQPAASGLTGRHLEPSPARAADGAPG